MHGTPHDGIPARRDMVKIPFPPVRPMLMILILLGLTHYTCSTGLDRRNEEAPATLAYTIERKSANTLHISLSAPGSPDGRTVLAITETWGGAGNVADEVSGLRVRGASGDELPFAHPQPYRWTVTHVPGERLTVDYELRGAGTEVIGRHRYLPVITDDLVLLIGQTALIRPENRPSGTGIPVEIRWKGFDDPDCEFFTSFGTCDGTLKMERPLQEVIHAFYAAGKMRLHERDLDGAPLYLAVTGGEWRFSDEDFCGMTAGIMAFERNFFGDLDHPPYSVMLVPYPNRKQTDSSAGGTCLTDSFLLYMTTHGFMREGKTGLEPFETLITHEYFHNWNKPGADDDSMHWFSEGFTVFYERRILYRLGMFTAEEYVSHLNRKMREYMTSPHREAPNSTYVASRMLDRELQSLPYVRGAVIAVMVDHEIRRASGGTRCLDDFMLDKAERERIEGAVLGNEAIFDMIAKETNPEFAATIRTVAIDGAPAVLAPDTYSKCLEMTIEQLAPFELGFDFEASHQARTVKGVEPGTKAHAAGLRDGQKLASWSVHHDQADKPVKLGVVIDGKRKTITYMPQAAPVAVPQFSLRPLDAKDRRTNGDAIRTKFL